MTFTQEQIQGNGIVVNFLKQSAIAHTAEEAEHIINTFTNQHGDSLTVNDYCRRQLHLIFSSEEDTWNRGHVTLPELKTTGCSKYAVRFFPAMAPTIDEHNALYEAQLGKEREERKRQAELAKQRLLSDYNEQRRGWYCVEVEVTGMTLTNMRTRYVTLRTYGIADSKMDAYVKATNEEQLINDCASRSLTFASVSEWNSSSTDVEFLGMKIDDGYSIDEWEAFSQTGEYKNSIKK